MVQKEAKARIKINKLLEDAGWRFFDNSKGKANITLETNTKITEKNLNELGENFEKTKNGYTDYLLNDSKGFPLVVLEAKSEDKNPLTNTKRLNFLFLLGKLENLTFVRKTFLNKQ